MISANKLKRGMPMKTFKPIIYLAVVLVFALSGIALAPQDK